MSLHPEREELMAWRDGEVSGERAGTIADHVRACAECRAAVDQFSRVSSAMNQWTVDATPAALTPRAVASAPKRRSRVFVWAAAAVVLIAVLASVRVECAPEPGCDLSTMHFAFLPHRSSAVAMPAANTAQRGAMTPQQAFEQDWLSRRRLPIPSGKGAKVTVVIFLDWQCPACRLAEQAYNIVFADFEKRVPGAVSVIIKDYPLNMRCNPNVPVEMHKGACEAAVAVRLAREHGTADALINHFFANQEAMTPDTVRAAAASIGKVTDFAARYPIVIKDVARDVSEGHSLEVGGTPTVFINGILARNDGGTKLFSPDEVRMAIEAELKRAK